MNDRERFLETAAAYDKYADDVDLSFHPDQIPCGEYICRLEELKMGTQEKDGSTYSWVKPIFHILSGPKYEACSLGDFFWFSPDPKPIATKMTMRRFLTLVRCLSGRRPKTMEEATAILREATKDVVVMLRVEEYTSKAGKKGHSVCYLSRVDASKVE